MQAAPSGDNSTEEDTEFSAHRAMAHVEVIARRPHPAGSAAQAEVREYLVRALSELGAEVEIQQRLQTYDYIPRAGQARYGYVANVVARFPGQQSESALALMAHYDSVPNGPGAGDNASGVAVTLEAVRALIAADKPLRNTIIVVLTDAEEVGLLGAQAFFTHHRWAEDVEVVLNFDSRGSRGPAFMYETSDQNGVLIRALAKAAPSPAANSLIYGIFQKMPNFTDLSIAASNGKVGMNFAFIDGFDKYHSSTDTPDRLSLNSLHHLGTYALSLAMHFGEANLPLASTPDRHYFNPIGHVFVQYPPWVDWVALGLAVLALFGTSVRMLQGEGQTIVSMLRGFGCALLFVAGPAIMVLLLDPVLDEAAPRAEVLARQRGWFAAWTVLAAGAFVWLHSALRIGMGWRTGILIVLVFTGLAWASGSGLVLWIVAMSIGGFIALLMHHPLDKESGFMGAMWFLAVLGLGMLLQLAGGAHIVVWPLFVASCMQMWRWRRDQPDPASFVFWVAASLPAAFLLGMTALNFDLFIGYALPVVTVTPLLLLLLFLTPILGEAGSQAIGLSLALIGIVALVWLAYSPPWTPDTPSPVSAFVLHDSNEQQTYWATSDAHLTDWHREVFGTEARLGSSESYAPVRPEPIWLSPLKDSIPLEPPSVKLLNGTENQLVVRLIPHTAGDEVTVWLQPGANLKGWFVDGQPLQFAEGDSSGWRSLTGFGLPSSGTEITLALNPGADWPPMLLVGRNHRLPAGFDWQPPRFDPLSKPYSSVTAAVAIRHVGPEDLLSAK